MKIHVHIEIDQETKPQEIGQLKEKLAAALGVSSHLSDRPAPEAEQPAESPASEPQSSNEAPEPPSKESNTISLSSGNIADAKVSEIKEAVGSLPLPKAQVLFEAELGGKSRTTALDAIAARIQELGGEVPLPDEEGDEPESSGVTMADLRSRMGPLVKTHREALKEKLTELGAGKLPQLDEEHYEAFAAFLSELESQEERCRSAE